METCNTVRKGFSMNNPWTGLGEKNAPSVEVPLHTLSNNNGTDLEIKIEADLNYDDNYWELVTELAQGAPINNPWTGEGVTGSSKVHVPLNTVSINNGRDLEIKIEWTNDNGAISKRFYKGWLLNEVFDYTRTSNGTTHYVYAKFSEDGEWYKYNQHPGSSSNNTWEWAFSSPSGSQQIINQNNI